MTISERSNFRKTGIFDNFRISRKIKFYHEANSAVGVPIWIFFFTLTTIETNLRLKITNNYHGLKKLIIPSDSPRFLDFSSYNFLKESHLWFNWKLRLFSPISSNQRHMTGGQMKSKFSTTISMARVRGWNLMVFGSIWMNRLVSPPVGQTRMALTRESTVRLSGKFDQTL